MKKLFAILIVGIVFLFGSGTLYSQCLGVTLFTTGNDLSPQSPCIFAYSGSATTGTYCSASSQTGFTYLSGTHYIIIGPFPAANPVKFKYYTNYNGQFSIETGASGSGPWTSMDAFTPTTNACTQYISGTNVTSGYFVRITKGFPGGGGGKIAWIREIELDPPTPVQLVTFQASKTGNSVKLQWKTATEINNFGFEVERDLNNNQWEKIGFVNGSGTVNTPTNYSFTDVPAGSASGTIRYRLHQIDRDGSTVYSPVVSVFVGKISSFGIIKSYPNPFNPTTTITFNLPADSRISLVILDETGKEVESLVKNESLSAGSYSRIFSGSSLSSGTYIAWLYSSTESSVYRISLVK